MKILNLDASQWKSPVDFYAAVNAAVKAPEGYSHGVNALFEAMIWDHAGDPDYPPYAVRIYNLPAAPQDVQDEVSLIAKLVPEVLTEFQQRKGRSFPLAFEILSSL
jgi:hypothetical protein